MQKVTKFKYNAAGFLLKMTARAFIVEEFNSYKVVQKNVFTLKIKIYG